jgi:hypothetical protein
MCMEAIKSGSAVIIPLKERLFQRLLFAKEQVGRDWKNKLADSDPFFDTKRGTDYMNSVSRGLSNKSTVGPDRLERVTLALEKLAGIDSQPL